MVPLSDQNSAVLALVDLAPTWRADVKNARTDSKILNLAISNWLHPHLEDICKQDQYKIVTRFGQQESIA
jgi:hypothetical protein